MKRQWITAVMVGMLALAVVMTAPASAQVICKAQAQLCPTTGCALGSASGVAEVKFQNAVTANALLKIKGLNAANQFDADVQGLKPLNAYTVTGSDSGGHTVAIAVFGTDGAGQGDADVKGLAGQSVCSIKTVKVTQFGSTSVLLQGTIGGVNNDPPEVQAQAEAEMELEMQAEAQAELNDVVNP